MSDPIVIIGGGLGGLSAGVALAQKGYKVTLLEKEPRLGGYAIAFRRGAYTFDLALHVTAACGPGHEFHKLIRELGLDESVSFLRLKQGFGVHLGDYTFQMPNDYDALFHSLAREFPAEQNGLNAFRRHLEKHVRVYAPLFDRTVSKWRSVPPFLPRIPGFLRHAAMPTRRYLRRFFRDPRLMAILYQPAVFMGIPPDEFPAINFMMMFHVLLCQGMGTIAGGGQALTDALRDRLKALGVEIVTRAKVEKILLHRKTAVAVRTADGAEHRAGAVVAGVSLPMLVDHLVGRTHFPAPFLKRLDSLRPSLSVVVLNLGLDCHPRELGITGHIAMAFPGDDLNACMKEQRRTRASLAFSITAHGNTEPQIAPRDQSVLTVVGGTDPAQWLDLSDEQYREAKTRTTEELLGKLERLFPGTAAHATITDLATPRTLRRYTENPSGAILGFACTCGVHRSLRAVSRLPVKGLYPAGAWTDKLGGFLQAVKSGVAAADSLSREQPCH